MIRKLTIAAASLLLAAGTAYADPLDGNWRTQSGETAAISGGSIVLKTGKYAGKRIGSMKAAGGGRYTGTITDPANDKTYTGSAKISGKTMRMQGCVAKVLCRSQTWTKL